MNDIDNMNLEQLMNEYNEIAHKVVLLLCNVYQVMFDIQELGKTSERENNGMELSREVGSLIRRYAAIKKKVDDIIGKN